MRRRIEQPDDPRPDQQQGHLVISSCGHQFAVDDPLALVAAAVADPQLSTFMADGALMPAHRFVDVPLHLDDGAGIGGESPHGCSPVVSIQAPMWLMSVKRHCQWRRMPGHCVGAARWAVDPCRPWVSTEWAHRGLLVPSIAEKRRCGRYPPPSLSPPEQIACWRPTPTTIISKPILCLRAWGRAITRAAFKRRASLLAAC